MKVRMWERTRAWQQWKRTSLWGCYGLYWILYKQCKHTYKLLAVTYVALRKARKKDRPEGKGRHWEALLEHAARYGKSMESRKMVPWSWPWMTCFPFHPSRTKRIEWIVLCTSTEYSTKMYKDVQSTIRIPLQGHSNVSRKSQHCNCCNWTSKKELENIWELCNLRKNSNYSASRCVAASLRCVVLSISRALKASTGISRWPPQTCAEPCEPQTGRHFSGSGSRGALSMPSTTSTLPSARLPARRCVCKYSGEAESGSPWHRAPGTGHRTAPYSAKHRIYCCIGNTRSCLTISSCLRISQNWMKETECSPENFAGQKRPKSLQHLQRLSNLPSLTACIAHCAHCTHCIDQLICDLHLQLPCASCRSAWGGESGKVVNESLLNASIVHNSPLLHCGLYQRYH